MDSSGGGVDGNRKSRPNGQGGPSDRDDEDQELGRTLGELTERLRKVDDRQEVQAGELRGVRNTLGELRGQVGGLEGKVTGVSGEVAALRTDMTQVKEDVAKHHALLEGIREDLRRKEAKDDARAQIDWLTAERERRFGQRDEIRSLARGLVDTLTKESVDRGMVNTSLIRKCVEEHFLHEPRFWLAPALMHVAATYCELPQLSQEARGHAMLLDKSKAHLFFALTSARLENYRLAGSSMDNYLQSLVPARLTQDFLVVLEAVANRELGPQAEKFVVRTMDRWFAEAPAAPDGERRAHERRELWRQRMWNLRARLPEDEYAAFRSVYAGDWKALVEGFEQAAVAQGTLDHLSREFPERPAARSDLRHMDSALEHLINRLEPDEAELHARIEWQQRIYDMDGDRDAARREHEQRQSVDVEVMTFEQLLDNAVFKPSQVELGLAARRLALMCVWPQIQSVATAFVETSLQRRPRHLPIVIDEWRDTLPADPATPVQEQPLQAALALHVEEVTRRRVEEVRLRRPRLVAGGLGVIVGTVAAVLWQQVALVLFVVAGLLLCGYEYRWVPAEQRRLRAVGRQRRQEVADLLGKALVQRRMLISRWDRYADGLTDLTGWLPPGERRSP
ncbi:hypothetical protein ACFW2D_19630 [Streptomyces sp. NPDC058914]|uniref:hypothetical protein n=1 Tax=Streptomyces sp. NPDC058914 TaxID=3346671 RepID=UPI0036B94F47